MTSGSAYALRIPFTTLMKMNSNAGEREGGSLGHVSSVFVCIWIFSSMMLMLMTTAMMITGNNSNQLKMSYLLSNLNHFGQTKRSTFYVSFSILSFLLSPFGTHIYILLFVCAFLPLSLSLISANHFKYFSCDSFTFCYCCALLLLLSVS